MMLILCNCNMQHEAGRRRRGREGEVAEREPAQDMACCLIRCHNVWGKLQRK